MTMNWKLSYLQWQWTRFECVTSLSMVNKFFHGINPIAWYVNFEGHKQPQEECLRDKSTALLGPRN